jgi:hypothetical protein
MKNWEKHLDLAIKHKNLSERYLDTSIQELMRTKGFTAEQVILFRACFAGGNETVVSFNSDGEFNDLGVIDYANMDKEEIISYLSDFLDKENIGLLKG